MTLVTLANPAWATDTGLSGFNLEFFHPSIDLDGGFGVNGPAVLKPGHFYFKIGQSYASKYLLQTAVGGAVVDLVDKIATTDFTANAGLTRGVSLAVSFPVHLYAREANFNSLDEFSTASLGDVRLSTKFKLLEEKGHRPGLALLLQNEFPTGNEKKFLGAGKLGVGFDLAAGKKFGRVKVSANAGMKFLRQRRLFGTSFDDRFVYGATASVPVDFVPGLSVLAEMRGHFDPAQIQIITAPVEYTAGLRQTFKNGFTLDAGAGGGLNNAVGNPGFRGVLTVGYAPKFGFKEKSKSLSVVYFETGKYRLGVAEPPLEKAARWLNKHPHQRVSVEGHADATGSRGVNRRISRLRADYVRKNLTGLGVDPSRIEVKALGDEKPTADNDTEEGRKQNRRVEIKALRSR